MEDCIFCKIIKGDIPAEKVYEDENVLAFNDINPNAKIHILVIPKKHIKDVDSLEDEDHNTLGYIFKAMKKIAKDKGLDSSGYRIIVNNGKDAHQEVKHLHFHILGGCDLGGKLILK